jgi:hypothetical protein
LRMESLLLCLRFAVASSRYIVMVCC